MINRSLLKRVTGVVAALAMSALMPQALNACVTHNYPNGTQTITCCGDTACCTTTWHGSELISKECT
jgi:hypothetical protein